MKGLSPVDLVALAVLLVGLPALSVQQVRLLAGARVERLRIYISSAVTLVVLGGVCLVLGLRRGTAGALGLGPASVPALFAWSVGITAAGLAIMFGFRGLAGALALHESPFLRALLPRTGRERIAFVALSGAAGVGEELAYRSYAMTTGAVLVGDVGALALTSLSFGVMHAYQGWIGIVRTATLGGVLGWTFLASGSVWPAIVAHSVLDMLAGIVLADRLVVHPKPAGVLDDEETAP